MAVEEPSPAPGENGHLEQPTAEGANGLRRSKADKKKEKRQKQKQNRQQRRQQQQQPPEPSKGAAAASTTDDDDVVIEYVAAPAPDIEQLLQPAAPSSSRPAADAGDADADDERGYGGLGLGAAPGLGMSGLGFRRAGEPEPAAPVNTEEVMEQFKRVLERFMPQEGSEDGEAEAGGEAAANTAADKAEAAGPHSDADSDDEGERWIRLRFVGSSRGVAAAAQPEGGQLAAVTGMMRTAAVMLSH
eukprot:GHUV01018586.1.p1 GENE.GHUV01018586.1~~GHUV01018586.1.p1  ORF type:complete len:245 (+),score=116.57 GHUV01018586.1:298-1032(+)